VCVCVCVHLLIQIINNKKMHGRYNKQTKLLFRWGLSWLSGQENKKTTRNLDTTQHNTIRFISQPRPRVHDTLFWETIALVTQVPYRWQHCLPWHSESPQHVICVRSMLLMKLCVLTSLVAWWSGLYWPWGPGFDSRFCRGHFPLQWKIPLATMVWVACRI
jgi:hypothetical protein